MSYKQIYQDEAKISPGKAQYKVVQSAQLEQFPHNCIGWIDSVSDNQQQSFASGSLISPTYVLTTGHQFHPVIKGRIVQFIPKYFNLVEKTVNIRIPVVYFRVNPKLIQIRRTIAALQSQLSLATQETKIKQINKNIKTCQQMQEKQDYALLLLEKPVKRQKYLQLVQQIHPFPAVVVSGYVNDDVSSLTHQITHFNTLPNTNKFGSIIYAIDTKIGQSGSPAYIEDRGEITLIGIHKGFSAQDNLNIAVKINKHVILLLKSLAMQMKVPLEVRQSNQYNKDSHYEQLKSNNSHKTVKYQELKAADKHRNQKMLQLTKENQRQADMICKLIKQLQNLQNSALLQPIQVRINCETCQQINNNINKLTDSDINTAALLTNTVNILRISIMTLQQQQKSQISYTGYILINERSKRLFNQRNTILKQLYVVCINSVTIIQSQKYDLFYRVGKLYLLLSALKYSINSLTQSQVQSWINATFTSTKIPTNSNIMSTFSISRCDQNLRYEEAKEWAQ